MFYVLSLFFHHIHLFLCISEFLSFKFCGEIKLNWIDQLKKKTSLYSIASVITILL